MKKELIIALVFIMLATSLIMIGFGITGKAIIDSEYVKEVCTSNNDCSSNEICCLFYNEKAGVCNTENKCQDITELTKNTYFKDKTISSITEKPNNLYLNNIFFGLILFVITLISITFFNLLHQKRKINKISKKKKK